MVLLGATPEMVIDACSDRDHLDEVDSNIIRIKELMRCILVGLPYKTFGIYVEAYNPKSEVKLNNVEVERIEPFITTCPTVNRNGLWELFGLKSRALMRRRK